MSEQPRIAKKYLAGRIKPSCKKRRHSLQLMFWNVHDMRLKDEGLNTNSVDFIKCIEDSDILCLQETKESVKLPNYRCFNSNRPSSRSGGVCIAVRNELSKGVVNIGTKDCNDIIAVKLKKSHFAMSRDIAIINVYDSPTNSSYKKSTDDDQTTLEHVSNLIAKIPIDTGIVLMGDFNARIGSLLDLETPHFDPRSDFETFTCSKADLPPRSSRDNKINSNGRPFVEFLKANNLAILNGRTLGDVYGEATCIKYNGCSVVDYACSSINTLGNINSRKVNDLSYLSDHRSICVSFQVECQSARRVI